MAAMAGGQTVTLEEEQRWQLLLNGGEDKMASLTEITGPEKATQQRLVMQTAAALDRAAIAVKEGRRPAMTGS